MHPCIGDATPFVVLPLSCLTTNLTVVSAKRYSVRISRPFVSFEFAFRTARR